MNFVKFGIGEKRPLLLSLENTLMSIWLVEALASRVRSNLIIALCADVKIQAIVLERRTSMRITLDIPDGIICGFFNGVEHTNTGLQLVSYQLSSDDFADGNTVKLPRKRKEGAD